MNEQQDGDPASLAQSQEQFESMFDDEQLDEPLDLSDADTIGENLMNLQCDIRLCFTRARRQYRGDTWISNELWQAHLMAEQLWEKLQMIYDNDGFDHPDKRTR
jgi:hypothetical protein